MFCFSIFVVRRLLGRIKAASLWISVYIITNPWVARRGPALCGCSGVWAALRASRDSSPPPVAGTRWGPPSYRMCTGSNWGGKRDKTSHMNTQNTEQAQQRHFISSPWSHKTRGSESSLHFVFDLLLIMTAVSLLTYFSVFVVKTIKCYELWTLQCRCTLSNVLHVQYGLFTSATVKHRWNTAIKQVIWWQF